MKQDKNSVPLLTSSGKVVIPRNYHMKIVADIDQEGYKDYYTAVYSKLKSFIKKVHTLTANRVLLALICELPSHTKSGSTIAITQKELARLLDMHQPEIFKGIEELMELGLIVSKGRGRITLNPRYFWVGTYAAWQKAVEEQEQLKELANGNT